MNRATKLVGSGSRSALAMAAAPPQAANKAVQPNWHQRLDGLRQQLINVNQSLAQHIGSAFGESQSDGEKAPEPNCFEHKIAELEMLATNITNQVIRITEALG